jgi:hypothetical protein
MWDLNDVPEDIELIAPIKKPTHHFPKPAPVRPANYKTDMLKVYQSVFEGVSVDSLSIKPILVPKNTLMGRIEQIYDKQTAIFLKKKSFKDFDFPGIVRETTREKFGQSGIYSYQALCNLLYSTGKYLDQREVKTFHDFIVGPKDNHRLAYYLYLRQFTKIIGHVNFISHHKSIADPYKIALPTDTCIKIIRSAFITDDYLYSVALDELKTLLEAKKSPSYYEFLTTIFSIEADYKTLPLDSILTSLYTPKKPEETTRFPMNFADPSTSRKQVLNSTNNEEDFHTQSREKQEADFEKDEAAKIAALENNEKEFFRSVKSELQDFARFFTVTFMNERDIVTPVSNAKFEGVVQQLYKKLYHITVAIFLVNKKKFLKLLRSKSDSENQLEQFWVQISGVTGQLKGAYASSALATDFLNALMKFESLRKNMNFFLEFQLETDINELLKPNKIIPLS